MAIATLIALCIVISLLSYMLARILKDAPDSAELAGLRIREQDFRAASAQLQEKSEQIQKLIQDNATLSAELANEQRNSAENLKLLQDSEVRLKTEFENLANRIFAEKGKTLTEDNRAQLSDLLRPFTEQLNEFRKRVDEVHSRDTEQSAQLIEQVRQLQELSNKVSDEANNLAKAIKGDTKVQGDWGELIVERIFESSGLQAGREYDCQVGLRAEDGSLKKPDFIVYLPGDKVVIVDAKVSLTAFEKFCAEEDITAKDKALQEHIQSVRRHIDGLRSKDYSNLLGSRSLDFVIMCIPLEPAYQAALQADQDLIYELGRTNIVISGPNTLMITLKLISQIWRREKENLNAALIADKAGRLYDQVTLIATAMHDAKNRLKAVTDSFEVVSKRLNEGKGNLIGRVEELRKLGAKVNKQLPTELVEQAASFDDQMQISDETTTDALMIEAPADPFEYPMLRASPSSSD